MVLGIGSPLTGVTWDSTKPLPLKLDYEITFEARRVQGSDFFCGLTFPHQDASATLILGGWGGSLVGISCLDGDDASENDTTRFRTFEKGRWYKIRLRVTAKRIQAWIDERIVVDCDLRERKLETRIEVRLNQPLGISTYETQGEIRELTMTPWAPPPPETPAEPHP